MHEDQDTLYYWAERYCRAIDASEEAMPSMYADAEVEYCEDEMRRHLCQTAQPETS